ncbi:MAG: tyrosinase family protein [Gemmatimonadetes bacterium]|nr:tyrosinase family protein [Gemmatimonadota bacterium]
MPTIRFDSLTCVTAQDLDGQDEAFLAFFVDGEYIGNVYRPMRSNTQLALGFELEYQNTLRIQLWEVDDPAGGNAHDFIGEINLDSGVQTGNEQLLRAGGDYTLDWTLVQQDGPAETIVRRDQVTMSAAERTRFRDGIDALIADGTFGDLVVSHAGADGSFLFRNHGFVPPSSISIQRFLPWHRVYLRRLEEALQQVDSRIFLPYWRGWADRGIPAWLADFTPDVALPGSGIDGQPNPLPVTRAENPSRYPTISMVQTELAPADYTQMTTRLEGGSHGAVHMAVGGTMRNAVIASADVLFWMHHCEIDRLWSLWQAVRQGNPLLSITNREMTPWNEDVSDVLSTQEFGYLYA